MIFIVDQKPDYKWEIMQGVPSSNFMQLNYVIQLCAGGIPVKLFGNREKERMWKADRERFGIDPDDYQMINGGVQNSLITLGRHKRKFLSHRIYYYPKFNRIIGVLEAKNPRSDNLFGMEEMHGYPYTVLSSKLLWKYHERTQEQEYRKGIWDEFLPEAQHV